MFSEMVKYLLWGTFAWALFLREKKPDVVSSSSKRRWMAVPPRQFETDKDFFDDPETKKAMIMCMDQGAWIKVSGRFIQPTLIFVELMHLRSPLDGLDVFFDELGLHDVPPHPVYEALTERKEKAGDQWPFSD